MVQENNFCSQIVNQMLSIFTQQTTIRQRMKEVFEQLSLVAQAQQLAYFHHFDGKLYLEGLLQEGQQPLILPHFPLKNWNERIFHLIENAPKKEGVQFINLEETKYAIFIVINGVLQTALYFHQPKSLNEDIKYHLRLLTGMTYLYFNDQRGKEQNKILQRTIKKYQESVPETLPLKGQFKLNGEWNIQTGEVFPNDETQIFWGSRPKNISEYLDLIHANERSTIQKQLFYTVQEKKIIEKFLFKMIDVNGVYHPVIMILEKAKENIYKWWLIDVAHHVESSHKSMEAYQENRILNLCPSPLIGINTEGVITLINKSALQLFDYQREEVFGKNVKMLMPSDYASINDHFLKKYQENKNASIVGQNLEIVGRRKNGELLPLSFRIEEEIQSGQIILYAFIEDLTEKKNLLNHLEQINQAHKKEESNIRDQIQLFIDKLRAPLSTFFTNIGQYKADPSLFSIPKWESTVNGVKQLLDSEGKKVAEEQQEQIEEESLSMGSLKDIGEHDVFVEQKYHHLNFQGNITSIKKSVEQMTSLLKSICHHEMTGVTCRPILHLPQISILQFQLDQIGGDQQTHEKIVSILHEISWKKDVHNAHLQIAMMALKVTLNQCHGSFHLKEFNQERLTVVLEFPVLNTTKSTLNMKGQEEHHTLPSSILALQNLISNNLYIDSGLIQLFIDQMSSYDEFQGEVKELKAYLSNLDYKTAKEILDKIRLKWDKR